MPRLSFSILFVLLVQYSFGQSDFFYEDFSNGLNGATAYGAWTTEDTGTSDIWMMADENSPGGEFSNAAQALASESAEMPESEPSELDFVTGTVGTRTGSKSEPGRTEPDRGLSELVGPGVRKRAPEVLKAVAAAD